MKKTALVIMAAGVGSRFGNGIKQLAPVGPNGEIIMDYSIRDALEAGFNKIVFIIRKDLEEEFKSTIGARVEKIAEVAYAYQEMEKLPEGFVKPADRTKPWGTGHAVICAREFLTEPFAVINADDYYGREAFQLIYDYLNSHEDDDKFRYTMVGYKLCNTVTENGYVSRGVCEMNEAGELIGIRERTRIEHHENGIAFTEDDGATWTHLDDDTTVSMNMWGLTPDFLGVLEEGFKEFFEKEVPGNPMKAEYLIPIFIGELLEQGKMSVKVLKTNDTWYGMTYHEDVASVKDSFKKMLENGVYKADLFSDL